MSRKFFSIVFVLILALSLLTSGGRAEGLSRVTGSGMVHDPSGALRVATVTARIMPDGEVKGELQGVLMGDPNLIVHGKIDCIRFFEEEDGIGAVLSGWTTGKNLPAGLPNPMYIIVAVFDAGEGNDAEDIFSRAVPAPFPEVRTCLNYTPPLTPLEHGNVQVSE